jgi:hypothetical protein
MQEMAYFFIRGDNMAFTKPYDIVLDVKSGLVEGNFILRQASDGVHTFKAKLMDGETPFVLTGLQIKAVFKKTNGTRIDVEVNEIDYQNSVVTVPVKETVLNSTSAIKCEIVLLDIEGVEYLPFQPFAFMAEKNYFMDGLTESNEFNILINALNKVEKVEDFVE